MDPKELYIEKLKKESESKDRLIEQLRKEIGKLEHKNGELERKCTRLDSDLKALKYENEQNKEQADHYRKESEKSKKEYNAILGHVGDDKDYKNLISGIEKRSNSFAPPFRNPVRENIRATEKEISLKILKSSLRK